MLESTSESKYIFFAFRDKKNDKDLFQGPPPSSRKYEDTVSTRIWRIYGKLIWRPFLRFIRRSSNSRPYRKSFFKAILPKQVEHPEFQMYHFIFMNKAYYVYNPFYILCGYPVGWIRNYFHNNSFLVCNWSYSVSKTWRNPIKYKLLQRPFIYFAKFIEYTYRSDFHCCGYSGDLCEEEDEGERFELINSGADATPDGTDHWFAGYVHCRRCNTPIYHSDGSL